MAKKAVKSKKAAKGKKAAKSKSVAKRRKLPGGDRGNLIIPPDELGKIA
jgi:hypothetical protein